MVRLIVGQRGKGKTTSILAHVNEQIKKADGNIVYLDKSSKHMYMYPGIRSATANSSLDLSAALSHRTTTLSRCISTTS